MSSEQSGHPKGGKGRRNLKGLFHLRKKEGKEENEGIDKHGGHEGPLPSHARPCWTASLKKKKKREGS